MGKTIRHNKDGSRTVTRRSKGAFGTTHVRSHKTSRGCLPGCLIYLLVPFALALLLILII